MCVASPPRHRHLVRPADALFLFSSPNALRAAILNGGTVPPSALPSIAPSTTNSASASPAPGTPASDADSTSTPRKRTRRPRDLDIINPALLLDTNGPSSAGRKRRSQAATRSYSDAIDAADDDDFEQQLVKKAEDEERRKEKAAFDKLQAGHSTDGASSLSLPLLLLYTFFELELMLRTSLMQSPVSSSAPSSRPT